VGLVLLIGGARSGKSRLALELASQQSAPVVFVATGEPLDPEMADRIDAHRAERPASWTTVEAPIELCLAIAGADAHDCVIVDCLTLWTSNALARFGRREVEVRARQAASAAAARPGLTLAVTNEVGSGIVPDSALARGYRDLLGVVNATWAAVAQESLMLVAGRVLRLASAASVMEELR
jgi:adenosylcobinamide kinase/adenosylcobinamide-phosphate guanylyltransferase